MFWSLVLDVYFAERKEVYKQRWRMIGLIQNLGLMIGGIKDLEHNYIHWFGSLVWRFLKI